MARGPRNWSTTIFNNLVWAKVQLIRKEKALQAGIDLKWYKARDDIGWAIGRVPDLPNIRAQATWLTDYELDQIFGDFFADARFLIGEEMVAADAFMVDEVRKAFFDKAPWLNSAIPYSEAPVKDYQDILSMEFLETSLDAWEKRMAQNPKLLPAMRKEFIEGMVKGESMEQIARRLQERSKIARTSARAMARTAVQSAANDTLNRVYKANEDLIKGYKYTATLDTATCEICGGYDGQTYGKNEDRPYTPAHPACRCLYTVILKSYQELGLGPAVVADPQWRASMDGREPATKDYAAWFKDQGEKRQREILGSNRRFELWKAGKWKPRFLEHRCTCGEDLIYEEAA